MKRVVVKLSGSVFSKGNKELIGFATIFKTLLRKDIQTIVVTGGGEVARRYISMAREMGRDEASLDEMGIEISRLNADLLISALKEAAYPSVPKNLTETVGFAESGKVVVSGGLHPGQSTNATSALIAEKVGASLFVNGTDVDGVYAKDPRKSPRSKVIKQVKPKDLYTILQAEPMSAGTYELLDIISIKIIERSRIPTKIVLCSADKVRRAILGEKVGTSVITGK
ncbi:MAG: UMP kinase [Nitrososphaerales archaeon]